MSSSGSSSAGGTAYCVSSTAPDRHVIQLPARVSVWDQERRLPLCVWLACAGESAPVRGAVVVHAAHLAGRPAEDLRAQAARAWRERAGVR